MHVPFFIILYILDRYKLYANNVENVKYCAILSIVITLQPHCYHTYFAWEKESKILYTLPEHLKPHMYL